MHEHSDSAIPNRLVVKARRKFETMLHLFYCINLKYKLLDMKQVTDFKCFAPNINFHNRKFPN